MMIHIGIPFVTLYPYLLILSLNEIKLSFFFVILIIISKFKHIRTMLKL